MIQKMLSKWYYADGAIRWIDAPCTKTSSAGDPVPHFEKKSGHRVVSFWHNGKTHKLQYGRVVWLLVHGEFPLEEIDHIDRNPANNRIENLRIADRCQNNWNRALTATMGVHKHGPSWRAEVVARKRKHRVNGFCTKEAAVEFRDLMVDMLHGEFANRMLCASAFKG